MALSPEERARINRENAKKSTGPKTAEGKARSCMNARRNWLNGQFFIFTEEERLAYLSYAQQQRIAYAPVGPLEDDLVQHIIDNSWLIRRYQSAEFNVRSFEGLPALNAGHDGEVPAAASEHKFLFKSENGLYSVELLGRHYARVERTLLKYRAELWKAQKERRDAKKGNAQGAPDGKGAKETAAPRRSGTRRAVASKEPTAPQLADQDQMPNPQQMDDTDHESEQHDKLALPRLSEADLFYERELESTDGALELSELRQIMNDLTSEVNPEDEKKPGMITWVDPIWLDALTPEERVAHDREMDRRYRILNGENPADLADSGWTLPGLDPKVPHDPTSPNHHARWDPKRPYTGVRTPPPNTPNKPLRPRGEDPS
jgi:hypothetical protein